MLNDNLKSAYFHFRAFAGTASAAMEKARRDIANGKTRYASSPWGKPSPARVWQGEAAPADTVGTWANPFPRKRERLAYVECPDAAGLRPVGRVTPESYGGRDTWDTREACGWHTDPYGDTFKDGSGLCYGLVFQLPGRDGVARFVAGYQFGGVDGGPTIDFGTIYSETVRGAGFSSWDNARDYDAAREAARAADALAQHAAEEERDYQAAWQAGSRYAEKGQEVETVRRDTLAILKERRAARELAPATFPALCAAIRSTVSDALNTIERLRKEREALKAGDHSRLTFYPDARLRAAFNEGAGA